MVLRLRNIGQWAPLGGKALVLPGDGRVRAVRLEVNCETSTRFDIAQGDAPPTLLGVVHGGSEVIEFSASGDLTLTATSEGEVYYFTNDGGQTAFSRPEAVSFTKIASREQRNPQLEKIMWAAELNQRRRDEAAAVQIAALNERLAQIEAANADPETGEVDDSAADDTATASGTSSGRKSKAAGTAPPPAEGTEANG